MTPLEDKDIDSYLTEDTFNAMKEVDSGLKRGLQTIGLFNLASHQLTNTIHTLENRLQELEVQIKDERKARISL